LRGLREAAKPEPDAPCNPGARSGADDMKPRILGVIPARGGSKRLPNKNILPCGGKPMIAHSIEAAAASQALDSTIFSTDSEKIRAVALEYGADAPFLRPAELATDSVRNIDVILHALDYLELEHGLAFDAVVLLQPTSPLRTARHIDEAIEVFLRNDPPTLASVVGPIAKRQPTLMRAIGDEVMEVIPDHPAAYYRYNASIYIARTDYIREHRSIHGARSSFYVMPETCVDVDEAADFAIADFLLKQDGR
jgi:CMP-N-acetylneuraminic acid synthetase